MPQKETGHKASRALPGLRKMVRQGWGPG
jgi:hypothetical protein